MFSWSQFWHFAVQCQRKRRLDEGSGIPCDNCRGVLCGGVAHFPRKRVQRDIYAEAIVSTQTMLACLALRAAPTGADHERAAHLTRG